MRLFFILSPFAVLSALLAIAPLVVAVSCAAAVTAGLLLVDLWRCRTTKLLPAATLLLLAAIGAYAVGVDPHLGSNAARIALDGGLLIVVAAALAMGFPFTVQYARETVDADTAARPEFNRANRIVTGAWIAAFAVMLVADAGAIYWPWLPLWAGVVAAFAARNGAALFTQWYAARRRRIGEAQRASAIRLQPALGDVA